MNKSDTINSAPVTEAITAFATGSLDEGRSEAALRMTRISLFDWLAVSIAAQDEPVSRIVRDYVSAEGGVTEATVVGTAQKLPARARVARAEDQGQSSRFAGRRLRIRSLECRGGSGACLP